MKLIRQQLAYSKWGIIFKINNDIVEDSGYIHKLVVESFVDDVIPNEFQLIIIMEKHASYLSSLMS